MNVEVDEEVRAVFFEELAGAVPAAVAAHRVLQRSPADVAAQAELKAFFHRMAGSAGSIGLGSFGRLCAVCECVTNVVLDGKLEPREAVRIWAEGLAGATDALEAR